MSRTVSLNNTQIEREIKTHSARLNRVRRFEGERALVSTLNKGSRKVQTRARRHAAKDIGIPQKYIRSRFYLAKRANRNAMFTRMSVKTYAINAISAGGRVTDEGITLGPYDFPSAFIIEKTGAKGKTQKLGIQRKTKKRYPTKPAEISSRYVGRVFRDAQDKYTDQYINGELDRDLHKELSRRLDRVFR